MAPIPGLQRALLRSTVDHSGWGVRWFEKWKGLSGPCGMTSRGHLFTASSPKIYGQRQCHKVLQGVWRILGWCGRAPWKLRRLARAVMWWELSFKVPEFQMQLTCSIVVNWGLTTVLDAEMRRTHLRRAVKLSSSSIGTNQGSFCHNTGCLRFWLRFLISIGHQALSSLVAQGPSCSLASPWQTAQILVHFRMVW